MRRYMTGRNKFTYDISADQSDSEDDISDNPDLDLEEDRSRKINIKKKRIAEKKKLAKESAASENGKEEGGDDDDASFVTAGDSTLNGTKDNGDMDQVE